MRRSQRVILEFIKLNGFMVVFPEDWNNLNIMEFYQIVIAVNLWGRLFANYSILFFTYNEELVSVINKKTSENSGPAATKHS